MLDGLLLKDVGPACAGARGKTNALSCICVNPSVLPMGGFLRLGLYTLKNAKTGGEELREH